MCSQDINCLKCDNNTVALFKYFVTQHFQHVPTTHVSTRYYTIRIYSHYVLKRLVYNPFTKISHPSDANNTILVHCLRTLIFTMTNIYINKELL